MDPHTSLGHLCMDERYGISINDKIESEGNWYGPEYQDIVDNGKEKEVKMHNDGVIDLEYEENLISNEFAIKLGLQYELKKNGEKVVNREVLVALKGELYFVSFIINPEEDDVEPGVIVGCSFLRITKEIVDFRNGILTIYPDLITFNDNSDDELDALIASINVEDLPPLDITDIPPFVSKMGKNLRNKRKPSKIYKMSYDGEGPSLTVNRPKTQE
ncbi:hypothetical protein Tco_0218258 [Tanacetum coccineum]